MAKNEELKVADETQTIDIGQMMKRLDMLDQRLDHIDSVVSAVVERVMKQPITLNVTCSHCGQNMEIAILGTEKPKR